MTDPSYHGQILVLTYPLIGNYGVPGEEVEKNGLQKWLESGQVWPVAVVVGELSQEYSHWNAQRSFENWLLEHGVPILEGTQT